VFNDSRNDSLWTDGSSIGNFFRETLNSHEKTLDISYGNYENMGRNFIGLTDAALTPTDPQRKEFLSVVLIHSLIHTGLIPGKESESETYGFQKVTPHDLKYLGQKYKDILKHCTKEGGSNLLYGQ
jgi:hypothetical protein